MDKADKRIKVLERKLKRSERSRSSLEDFKDRNQRLLMVVNSEAEEAKRLIERQNSELQRLNGELDIERKRFEDLLLNILPESVLVQIKEGDPRAAGRFDAATMLFADLVGFTPMSAQVDPTEVIDYLHGLFVRLDALTERHRVEKIKTIGDAYMVCAGAPRVHQDHAVSVAHFGLDMLDEIRGNDVHGFPMQFRVGMATGPVVGGIVGRKRFLYDVWGDAVNVAARMESTGIPGRLQATEYTASLLEGHFALEDRGLISVKGRGQMRTFFVDRLPGG